MTRYRALLAFALASCVAGCAIGSRYQKPEVSVPAAWREDSQPADTQPAAWPSEQWWQAFHSARLNEFIDSAARANDDLAAAVARVNEAEAQVRIAGAPLWPSLDLTGQATRERSSIAGLAAQPKTFNQYAPQIGASYQLDFWGKNRATRAAAAAAAAASRYDRETVELSVMTSVATTYFQALELHERLRVAQDNLATARELLDGLELERQVGTANSLDVAQQETVVATLNAALPPLEEQLTQTVDALAILIGQPPENVDVTASTLAELSVPEVRPGLPADLLNRRPDVAEAEAQLVAANADVNAARAALFPQITLTGDGGYASSALSTLLSPGSWIFSLTAGLTQSLFSGGALTGQVALNRARYQELLAGYHKAVLAAFGNVEDSLAGVRQTTEQERRQQQAVAEARQAYEFAQAQMRAGTINVLTVLNTESALFTAEDALVQVRLSHFEALVSLFNALGGGWQQS